MRGGLPGAREVESGGPAAEAPLLCWKFYLGPVTTSGLALHSWIGLPYSPRLVDALDLSTIAVCCEYKCFTVQCPSYV